MANSIGDLAVTLSLDAIAFTQGLDKSAGKLNSFAASAVQTFASIQAAASIGGAGYDFFKGGLESMVEEGRKARELGTDLNTLAALHRTAGADAEQFDRAMLHLNRELQVAATAGGEAANKFAALHLDAAKLAGLPLEQKVSALADRLNALSDGGERSAAAMEIFGERGVSILADLQKGSKGVADAIAQIKGEGGVGFTEADVGNAREAQKAVAALEDSFGKIKSAFIAEFAPVVKIVAEDLAGMVNKAGGLRGAFHSAAVESVNWLLKMDENIMALIPAADAFVHKFDKLAWVADKLSWIVEKFDFMSQGEHIGQQLGILPATAQSDAAKQAMDLAKKFHDDLLKQKADMEKSVAAGPEGNAAGAGGGEHLDKNAGPIKALTERLKEQISAFGLSGDALERYKLATHDATDAQLAGIDALLKEQASLKLVTEEAGKGMNIFEQHADQLANVAREAQKFADAETFAAVAKRKLDEEFAKKIEAEAQKVVLETTSPLDKFKADQDKFQKLRDMGAITDDQFAAETAKGFKDIGGSLDQPKIEHPGAALEGSDAAYNAITDFQDQGKQGDIQERIHAKLEQLVKQQETNAMYNRQMADAINRIFKKGG